MDWPFGLVLQKRNVFGSVAISRAMKPAEPVLLIVGTLLLVLGLVLPDGSFLLVMAGVVVILAIELPMLRYFLGYFRRKR